ncbi:MarR family winged helix-turn-helix transcriptional regulator [Spirillospora sp. NPDC050679]
MGQDHRAAASDDQLKAWATLFRANALFESRLEAALRDEAGMTLAEHELLAVLDGAGGRARMGDITESLMVSKSGVTRLVTKLEERNGWVARVLSPSDRRATWAELTASGRAAFTASEAVFRRALAELFAGHLGEAELRRLTSSLDHLVNANLWFRRPAGPAAGPATGGREPERPRARPGR